MAATLNIRARVKTLPQALKFIEQRSIKAMIMALNRTGPRAVTTAIRGMQQNLGATSQKNIRRSIRFQRANVNNPIGRVHVRGTQIPVIELGAKPKTLVKRRRDIPGIRWGKSQRLIPSSFIARMPSGHIGVFTRMTADRLPIAEAHGPSAALVFSRRKVQEAVHRTIREAYPVELRRAARVVGTVE